MLCQIQPTASDFIRAMVCHYANPLRKQKQILMLNGYIDDSGSEPSAQTFVLAGYVLPSAEWESFSEEWAKVLGEGRPIRFLHMKDTGKHEDRGQFAGWEWKEVEDKLYSLAKVIQAHKPRAIAAHTQWSFFQDWQQSSSLAPYIAKPYKALLHEITRIMYAAVERKSENSVDFTFDEQGEIGYEAASWYQEIKDGFPPEAKPLFGSTPIFKDDEQVLPLQAADMFAWFQRRRIWKPVVSPRMLEIESMITEHFTVGSELDATSYEKAAKTFELAAHRRKLRMV